MMQRTLIALLFAVAAGSASAQDDKSCTFVYNKFAKRVEMTCRGMPHAPLDVHDRVSLTTGKAKACVVRFDRSNANQPASKQAPRPGWVTTCK